MKPVKPAMVYPEASHKVRHIFVHREMEIISRGPILRGFCHYPHRGVDAGQHGCKITEHKITDSPRPPLLNVMYCVRVSLWTVKIFLGQIKAKLVISVYLCLYPTCFVQRNDICTCSYIFCLFSIHNGSIHTAYLHIRNIDWHF